MSSNLKLISSIDDPIDSDRPVLLNPKEEYELIYVKHGVDVFFGSSPKLTIIFQITSLGEHYGHQIAKYYNIAGKDKKKRIKPSGWHSDLVRDYIQLFGKPMRLSDIKVSMFEGKLVSATVRTVGKNSKQKSLCEVLKYSVVDKFIEVTVGD